ncbi:MAG: protein-L-isoaspartate O-methyltransferase [Pseudomonadota bacterium]
MDFLAARKQMLESQVRVNDVTDLRLQRALAETPRELFLPSELRELAYVERDIEYAPNRWLMRVRDFSKLIGVARPDEGELVLNLFCGSGYSAAILSQLSEMVVAVESDEDLVRTAEENLNTLGLSNAAVIAGAPGEGAAAQGPFDLIIIDGVVEQNPDALMSQLKDGGRLAAIVRENGVSRGVLFRRDGDVSSHKPFFDAGTKAVLPEFAAEKTFAF